jgi:hypothetical protein
MIKGEKVMDKIYTCTASGSFQVKENLTLSLFIGGNGQVIGFKLPDGRIVRPCICLEVESKDGNKFRYITSESAMAKLGFEGLDYKDTTGFEEDFEESERFENDTYEDMPLESIPANLDPRYDSTKRIIERRLKEGK